MQLIFALILVLTHLITFGQLASEPTSAPGNLQKTSTNDLSYAFTISFDASNDADRYLVLRSKSPISAVPMDGETYEKGQGLGDAKVFGTGSSTFVPIKEVRENTTYYFKIFAYNINGSDANSANYLQSQPLESTIQSNAAHAGNYYASIDFSSNTLLKDLSDLIEDHIEVSYDNYDETLVANIYERDTINDQKVVNCQYSNEFTLYNPPFNFFTTGYSREHRMAFSWIDFPNNSREDFELVPEGNDLHHLELVLLDVNQQRLNYPFSNDIASNIYTYQEFRQGRDSNNRDVAEVMEKRKGDVARALFYTMLCYNGKYGENWGIDNLLSSSDNQDIQQLLDWHNNDPVDKFEKTRNAYIFSVQENRNPFIDYPNLVDCIDFSDMTLKINCGFVSNQDLTLEENAAIHLFPNPAHNRLTVEFQQNNNKKYNWTLIDLNGKIVRKGLHKSKGKVQLQINLEGLSEGAYIFNAANPSEKHQKQLIVLP